MPPKCGTLLKYFKMAITTILERLLLNGQAKNKIHHIGFGSFAQIQIPTDSFIVIHKIYWNGFINQKFKDVYSQNWKQFFQYNEYQLKIQSDKESPMYYIFRNEVNFQYFGQDPATPLKLLNAPISDAQYDDYILMTPKKPVIFDTWITGMDYLNFTITRNALLPNSDNFTQTNQYSNEKPVPSGIQGQDLLIDCLLVGTNGTQTNINPVSPKVTPNTITLPNTNTANYNQGIDANNGADFGSIIAPPTGGLKLKYSDYVTNPLISFEYCIIQKNVLTALSPL